MKYIFVFGIVIKTIFANSDPLVKVQSGWIRGRLDRTFQNTTFYAFEQVPFAKPPVGELRFKPPQLPDNWEGVLNTTHMEKICIQLTRPGPESEDCLYLNVFTPKLPSDEENSSPALPVMFYIHGGGFYDGTARNLGPDRYIDNGVIFVAANYRMGPFGFLSTGDGLIPGNNGLKDQLMALKWVYSNIGHFGGDPDKITIFGHSAGGASVSYFLVNEKTQGLYRSVICQSGTALGIWALQRDPKWAALTYGQYLKNSSIAFEDTKELVDYLQKAETDELKKASYDFYFNHIFKDRPEDLSSKQGLYFGPVIEEDHEDAFITEKMYKSFKSGQVVKVPLMIGFTSEECLEYYRDFNRSVAVLDLYDKNLDWLVPPTMQLRSREEEIKMGELIRDIYTEGELFSQNIAAGVQFSSDNLLTRATMKQAELYSKFATTYFYVFSYDGELGGISTIIEGAGKVGHGEENRYLMCSGTKCDLSQYPESDRLMQEKLIKLWTNFAKFKNPTPNALPVLENISWPILTAENGDFVYLDIDSKLKVGKNPKIIYRKWEELYNKLENDDFDTY